jgi:hypothetical protein
MGNQSMWRLADGWRWLVEVSGPTWAAWVQAIGSIAAIVAAIWISREQARRDDRRRAAADAAIIAAVSDLFLRAEFLVADLLDTTNAMGSSYLHLRRAREVTVPAMRAALQQVDLATTRNAKAVLQAMDIASALDELGATLAKHDKLITLAAQAGGGRPEMHAGLLSELRGLHSRMLGIVDAPTDQFDTWKDSIVRRYRKEARPHL